MSDDSAPPDAPLPAPTLPDLGPTQKVSEADYILVTALATVRAALDVAREILPGVEGVVSADEVRAVLRGLHRMEAKLTFKMGTTDALDLALALEQP
jgi:hypothetical protein